jgi:hypothetical protein
MATTVHKSFPFLTIYWDDSFNGVLMEWKGSFQKGDQIKQGLDAGLDFLIEKKSTRWLADTKGLSVFTKDTQTWINENWFPRIMGSCARSMAVVVPANVLSQMSVESVMKTADGSNITVRNFSDVEDARKWMKTAA